MAYFTADTMLTWLKCKESALNLTELHVTGGRPVCLRSAHDETDLPQFTLAVLVPNRYDSVWPVGDALAAAAYLAQWHINYCSTVSQKFSIQLRTFSTNCQAKASADAFGCLLEDGNVIGGARLDQRDGQVTGIVGPACSSSSFTLGQFVHFFNLTLLAYSVELDEFSDHRTFPSFYRTSFTGAFYRLLSVEAFTRFKWKRAALIRSEEISLLKGSTKMRTLLEDRGFQVHVESVPPLNTSGSSFNAAFHLDSVVQSGIRVVILFLPDKFVLPLLCAAYLKKVMGQVTDVQALYCLACSVVLHFQEDSVGLMCYVWGHKDEVPLFNQFCKIRFFCCLLEGRV